MIPSTNSSLILAIAYAPTVPHPIAVFLHHMFWVLHLVEQLGEKEILILLCFYAKCAIVTHFKQNSVHWLKRNEIASFVLSFMSENIGHGMSTMINTREKWGVIPFLVKLYLFGMWRSKRVDQDP